MDVSHATMGSNNIYISSPNTTGGTHSGLIWRGYYGGTTTFFESVGIKRINTDDANTTANKQRLGFFVRNPIVDGALVERMSIQQDGYVGIGTTGPTHLLHLSGGAYCDGTGDWIAGSDRAYKKEIDYDFKYGLKEIEQLKPVYYVHKQDKENKKQIGFIAQDMLEVIPEVVSGSDGALGLSYGQLTAVLVKAVQEQQKEIDELKGQVRALKGAK